MPLIICDYWRKNFFVKELLFIILDINNYEATLKRTFKLILSIIFIISLIINGCSVVRFPTETEIPSEPVEEGTATEIVQTGIASYYAHKFHGRKTANGERFDMNALTAAHNTLPFNSIIKVTNLKNGKSVYVRINDRHPGVKGRIIDLSYQAAKELDMIKDGVVKVKIEIIKEK